MITSVEIARLLTEHQRRQKEQKKGFDDALLNLGVGTKRLNKKKKDK